MKRAFYRFMQVLTTLAAICEAVRIIEDCFGYIRHKYQPEEEEPGIIVVDRWERVSRWDARHLHDDVES